MPDSVDAQLASAPEPVAPVVAARRLEEAKADLIARAVATAPTQSPAQTAELAALVSRYYRHVAPEDLVGRDRA